MKTVLLIVCTLILRPQQIAARGNKSYDKKRKIEKQQQLQASSQASSCGRLQRQLCCCFLQMIRKGKLKKLLKRKEEKPLAAAEPRDSVSRLTLAPFATLCLLTCIPPCATPRWQR
jgi:hypothetical protein